jgi:hypothetical protein
MSWTAAAAARSSALADSRSSFSTIAQWLPTIWILLVWNLLEADMSYDGYIRFLESGPGHVAVSRP